MDQLQKNLHLIEYALMAAGGIILIACLIRWRLYIRRDPLRKSPIRASNLTPILMWLCVFINLAGWWAGYKIAPLLTPPSLQGQALESWQAVFSSGLTQVLMIVTCLTIAACTFTARLKGFGIGKRPLLTDLATGIAGWLAAICLCSIILIITKYIVEWLEYETPLHTVYKTIAESDSQPWMLAYTIFGAFILAPVGEELFFRGILQTSIKKLIPPRHGSMQHRWLAVTFTALLFGAMHATMPHHIPALIALGFILGYLYEKTGSIVTPIIVHILFNGKSLLWYHLQNQNVG